MEDLASMPAEEPSTVSMVQNKTPLALRTKEPAPASQGGRSMGQDDEPILVDDEGGDGPDHQDYGIVSNVPPSDLPAKKKRKRKPKPKSQRGLDKPTGFEEFFADTPITPDQHAQEREIYGPHLPFVDRILTAIARFERTRKMSNDRRNRLYKYLSYGGVVVGPNMFQGGQPPEGEDKEDKTDVATALTQASIGGDKTDLGTASSLYAVDFQGCLRGFLSRRARDLFGFDTRDDVVLLTSTLERFMDYLLQHDVCPEYADDLLGARNLARTAAAELWDAAEALRRLPGDFNIACTTAFGGSFAHSHDGETYWGPQDAQDAVFVGMKPEEASQVVHFGVAGAASEAVFAAYLRATNSGEAEQLETVAVLPNAGFEVTHIVPPTEECKDLYAQHAAAFRPVGLVHAKLWMNPDAPPEDLTPAERELASSKASTSQPHPASGPDTYVFILESILQAHLRVGTKVEASIRVLRCGIAFFDSVNRVFPSFDEFLCNEIMVDWVTPRAVKGVFDYAGSENGEDVDEATASDGIEQDA